MIRKKIKLIILSSAQNYIIYVCLLKARFFRINFHKPIDAFLTDEWGDVVRPQLLGR